MINNMYIKINYTCDFDLREKKITQILFYLSDSYNYNYKIIIIMYCENYRMTGITHVKAKGTNTKYEIY